jgi:hypothetical protein
MIALAVTALGDDPKNLSHRDARRRAAARPPRSAQGRSLRGRSRQCMDSIQRSPDSSAHAPGFRGRLQFLQCRGVRSSVSTRGSSGRLRRRHARGCRLRSLCMRRPPVPPAFRDRFVPVRRQALLGARTPAAQTRGRIRPHTPRRTRRSKHISSRSLSFLVKNARVRAPLGRRALTRRRPRHTGRVYPFLIGTLFLRPVPQRTKR